MLIYVDIYVDIRLYYLYYLFLYFDCCLQFVHRAPERTTVRPFKKSWTWLRASSSSANAGSLSPKYIGNMQPDSFEKGGNLCHAQPRWAVGLEPCKSITAPKARQRCQRLVSKGFLQFQICV